MTPEEQAHLESRIQWLEQAATLLLKHDQDGSDHIEVILDGAKSQVKSGAGAGAAIELKALRSAVSDICIHLGLPPARIAHVMDMKHRVLEAEYLAGVEDVSQEAAAELNTRSQEYVDKIPEKLPSLFDPA